MGCGASTPVKEYKNTTSARQHNDLRTQDSSQRGPKLYVGPNYEQIKHLGTFERLASWCCQSHRQSVGFLSIAQQRQRYVASV